MEKKKSHILVIVLNFLLLLPLSLVANNALADNDQNDNNNGNAVDTCKQIMVVGDINWPPYAIQEEADPGDNNIQENVVIDGIGIELVQKVFAELDIPVHVVKLDNKRNIFNGFHLGDIDVLVSTYANKDVEEVVDIIKPGYLLDPVVVYMRKGATAGINRWDDLIGKRGVMSDHFSFNSDFENYMNRYFYIHAKGDLATVIDLVNTKKADYVIGSRLQLEHGIKQANLQESMELLTTVSNPDEIHMGYSKSSLCKAYLPYLRKRLMELKEDGTIDNIVTRYLARDTVKIPTQDKNEVAPGLDDFNIVPTPTVPDSNAIPITLQNAN